MDSIIHIVTYTYITLYSRHHYTNHYGLADKMVIWWSFKDTILHNITRQLIHTCTIAIDAFKSYL